MSVLKPCVYCGGTDFSHMDRGGPICHRCTGTGSTYRPGDWNTRAPDWQDISTAPRDGTEIILFHPVAGVCAGFCPAPGFAWHVMDGSNTFVAQKSGRSVPTLTSFTRNPTHWMPLPAPPKEVG
jgi:hypothetical protein